MVLLTPLDGLFIIIPCSIVVVLYRWWGSHKAEHKKLPFPPGPRRYPLIGNLFDLARGNETAIYSQLAEKYGGLVFLSVFGKNVLFVNSFQIANDLFEKRSANYSDRPYSPMLHELMGWEWGFGHMPYGERWKTHRRMFYRQFSHSMAPVHWETQRKEAHALIRRILHTPQDLIEHLRHNAASLIMNLAYGINIAPKNDRYITIAQIAMGGMAEAANPGAFLVDLFPFLKHIPEWVPGAGFQRKARKWKEALYEMRDAPFETVKLAIKQGTASPCFVSNLVNDLQLDFDQTNKNSKDVEIIKACAAMTYAAGTESTLSVLSSFVLAIVLYPEVQTKAQKELDSVIGQGRLPDFNDRKSLPYINAIVKEILRWSPVAPLGLPHMVTNDDEYNGYFIPAGTTIVGNTWSILHDPELYPEPSTFNPDRFLGTGDGQELSPLDPLSAAFGYGRRICPGRFTAEAQLWISIACMLSAFNISCGTDEMGSPVKTEAAFTSGFICHPLPFAFSITPRSADAENLIEQTAEGDS